MKKDISSLHVPHNKNTAACAPVQIEMPKEVILPMNMHSGHDAEPIVSVGDHVVVRTGGMIPLDGIVEEGEAMVGAGYFSGAVVRALSAKGNYGADTNRDGAITLTELKRYLRDNHGASTVYTYPEEDGFA